MAITLQMTFQSFNNAATFTIEVPSASFDAIQTLNIGSQSTGAGAGKVSFDPLTFTRRPDGHSAEFFSRLCSGTPYQKVTLGASSAGGGAPFFSFTMGIVALKTLAFAAAEGVGFPLETISLEFGQAAYSVTPQNPDGTFGTPVASGWDRIRNISIDPARIGTL